MKNKVITITFLLFYCFMFIFSETFYGEGTSESPYLISTYLDLEQLRNYVNSDNKEYSTACYRQTCDIVFPDGIKWNPIGKLKEGILFSGEYNGDMPCCMPCFKASAARSSPYSSTTLHMVCPPQTV